MNKICSCAQKSPCLGCTRVADPESCENKRCRPWQRWFLTSWAQTGRQVREALDRAQSRGPVD